MDGPIFRSLEMIEARILEKLNVESIARGVHFSKYHYQRLFREIVGDSVMGYVTKRRLTLAGHALLETNATVLDIALRFGYDSHEGFTRSFKAYMGVTPTEYRKYRLTEISLKNIKGKCVMLYSKNTDGIIRELNDLIVRAKDTAGYTRKNKLANIEDAEVYAQFWDFIADKTDATADELKGYLKRVTDISQQPDEISARFMILKAIEDIAFKSNITAFNVGLMVARGTPAHHAVFKPLVDRYYSLAGVAHMKVGKIAEFFNELAAMIFEDMRKNANQKIQYAVEKGKLAAENLTSHADYPYGYIAHEILVIANELSSMPFADVSVLLLEDYLYRLDTISFAADAEAFQMPAHKEWFSGIAVFRESIGEVIAFFQSMSMESSKVAEPSSEISISKKYGDLAFQGNILLFYTRGEVQKLESLQWDAFQKNAFESICNRLNDAIGLAHHATDNETFGKIAELLQAIHREMLAEAESLGNKGASISLIAEEVKNLAVRTGDAAK